MLSVILKHCNLKSGQTKKKKNISTCYTSSKAICQNAALQTHNDILSDYINIITNIPTFLFKKSIKLNYG